MRVLFSNFYPEPIRSRVFTYIDTEECEFVHNDREGCLKQYSLWNIFSTMADSYDMR